MEKLQPPVKCFLATLPKRQANFRFDHHQGLFTYFVSPYDNIFWSSIKRPLPKLASARVTSESMYSRLRNTVVHRYKTVSIQVDLLKIGALVIPDDCTFQERSHTSTREARRIKSPLINSSAITRLSSTLNPPLNSSEV